MRTQCSQVAPKVDLPHLFIVVLLTNQLWKQPLDPWNHVRGGSISGDRPDLLPKSVPSEAPSNDLHSDRGMVMASASPLSRPLLRHNVFEQQTELRVSPQRGSWVVQIPEEFWLYPPQYVYGHAQNMCNTYGANDA